MVSIPTVAPRSRWLRKPGRSNVAAALSTGFLLLLIVVTVVAPWIAPYEPTTIDFTASLDPPSPSHLLGTDQSGRDLLSRLLYGTRLSLLGPALVLLIASVVGTAVGLLAAWRGGFVDTIVSRLTDVMFAFPGLLFAVFTIAVVGSGFTAAVVALGVAYFPTIAKLTRSVAQAEAARPYVDAYRLQGMGGAAISVTRVLPNILPVILGYVAVLFGDALMSLAALSFLGFGAQPPASDWGLMVSEAELALVQGSLWSTLAPATAIVLTVVAVNILGVKVADRLSKTEAP